MWATLVSGAELTSKHCSADPHCPAPQTPLDDPDLPPVPERPAYPKDDPAPTVVAWDMTMAGDTLADDILAIGAYCAAAAGGPLEGAGGAGDGGGRGPGRTSDTFHVDIAVPAGKGAGPPGVPSVVRGFCDVNARLLRGDTKPLTLAELGADVLREALEEEDEQQEPAAPVPACRAAQLVYRIMCRFCQCDLLSPCLSPLYKLSFSWACVARFAEWRFRTDHRLVELRRIVTTSKVGRGVKRKRALLKNLVSAGYTYQRLERDLAAMGEYTLRAVLTNKLRHMKATRESALTETREVGCTTVIEVVLAHFKDATKERAVRRLPPLLLKQHQEQLQQQQARPRPSIQTST
ncbi:SPRY domain-containing SOCS box protein 1 [Frankliniella fusca]|uniref:SPRY domain-containing SOCS box protein 1 n=1 Tax=Frankliniella fusca TaxID=407009 RepID=A0AAE1HSR4_9NEOP|nr:SPRY domain-containing SOCS box protein 1 [Frankliniella fusca]